MFAEHYLHTLLYITPSSVWESICCSLQVIQSVLTCASNATIIIIFKWMDKNCKNISHVWFSYGSEVNSCVDGLYCSSLKLVSLLWLVVVKYGPVDIDSILDAIISKIWWINVEQCSPLTLNSTFLFLFCMTLLLTPTWQNNLCVLLLDAHHCISFSKDLAC